jgi:hypothetical protein
MPDALRIQLFLTKILLHATQAAARARAASL